MNKVYLTKTVISLKTTQRSKALISFSLYNKLLREIGVYVDEEDSIRIYKIVGQGQVTILGKNEKVQNGDCIII